jgi:hypothetical protein
VVRLTIAAAGVNHRSGKTAAGSGGIAGRASGADVGCNGALRAVICGPFFRRKAMSDPVIHQVQLPPPPPPTKFERERSAFLRLLPDLLKTHQGKYVAIHEERVVAEGDDKAAVALAAYRQVGYVELFVGKVTTEPEQPVRLVRYRLAAPDVQP